MSAPVVAPCSYEAAKYACVNWHYSKRMPSGKNATYGVWEDGAFIGAVAFGHGSLSLGAQFGLATGAVVELRRVALTDHASPVSQIAALALRDFKRANPGTRLVVSFADPRQNHHGGIYQAGNWIYTGPSSPGRAYVVNGQTYHSRGLHDLWVTGTRGRKTGKAIEWVRANLDPNVRCVPTPPKLRYLMPLDRAMRRQVGKLAQDYPRRS